MKIKDLALGFQHTYFTDKYEIDSTLTSEQDSSLFAGQNLHQGYLNYIYLQNDNPIQSVFNIIEGNIQNRVNCVAINDITVLGVEFEFLKLFDTYYRYKTGRRTSTMFETYELMFLQGIRETSSFAPHKLKSELIKLLRRENDRNLDVAERAIATMFSAYEMYSRFPNEFKKRLEVKCLEYRCNINDFLNVMKQHEDTYNAFRQMVFTADYDFIRNNKKFNFWMNTGNIKISSIHSFKGWESDTVFLILQNRKEGDPSFDELLYTGITRTRSNLIIINLGNKEYDQNIRRLIENYK